VRNDTVAGSDVNPSAIVAGTSNPGLRKSHVTKLGCPIFSSPVRGMCLLEDLSEESDASDWEAIFRDCPEANPYSSDSDVDSSIPEPLDLLSEIGIYSQVIENLPFEEKYTESKWESHDWNFRGSLQTFSGLKPGPTSFYGRRKPEVQSFFSLFWPKEL